MKGKGLSYIWVYSLKFIKTSLKLVVVPNVP
jgi:hypothetical protein